MNQFLEVWVSHFGFCLMTSIFPRPFRLRRVVYQPQTPQFKEGHYD